MKPEYIVVLKQDAIICAQLLQHLLVDVEELGYNQSSLVQWLNRNDVKQVKIILDLQEEELYVERHPSLYTWEMKAFAQRQVHRRFPSSEFSRYFYTHNPQLPWQSTSGELWMSGFNESELVLKLMRWLDDAQVMVESLHSSMMLWQTWLLTTWFKERSARALFQHQSLVLLVRVSEQEFRQLLFVNGLLRTSRQVHVEAKELPEQMKLLIQEINLLEKFAKTQKLVDSAQTLRIFYLGRDTDDRQQALASFQQSNFASVVYEGHFVDMQSLIADLNLAQLYDRVMLLTLSSASLTSDYQPKIVQQVKSVQQARLALWAVWMVATFTLVGYVFVFLTHQYETERAIDRLDQVKQAQQAYMARFMSYSDLPVLTQYTLNDIKASVDAQEAIVQLQQQQVLTPILVPLSQVLAQEPTIKLIGFSVATKHGENKPNIKTNTPNQLNNGRLTEMLLSLTIEVNAQSSLAEKIGQVDQFLSALNAVSPTRLMQAKLIKVPFSVSSDQPLKFNLEDGLQKAVMHIPFEVSVQIGYE